MSGTQFRESDYGLVAQEFEGVADEFIVAAVMAAGAATALRPGSSMSVDETSNTATAMAVSSVPVANNPETQLACPSPNVKRPRSSCLAESGKIAARTNPRGSAAIGKRRSVEKHGGRDDEDSKPSLVTSSSALLVASYPDQEVVQRHYKIPSGWKRVKLEPDC
jgi:hypothetical protein